MPPAPEFVIEHSGPEQFANKLKKHYKQIFPITIIADIPTDILSKTIKKRIRYNV